MEINKSMSTERIQTLADGIFAIAMTLLVLSIEVPAPGTITSALDFQNYYLSSFQKYLFMV
ncbi:MAG: TMEM175 family protein [Methanobacteriaceae archaeon]